MYDDLSRRKLGKRARLRNRSVFALVLVPLLVSVGLTIIPTVSNPEPVEAAEPATACSSTAVAQNNVTVRPSHGKVMYIDTGQGQNINAAYVGYRVTAGANLNDIWVQLSGFDSNEVVRLANPNDRNMQIGDISNSSTGVAYFLLAADKTATSGQTHAVRVFSGSPDKPGNTALYECTFTFQKVMQTIKAAANKVRSVSSTSSSYIGGQLVVTHSGETGTIGSGTSSPDGNIIWVSPASNASWPTYAYRLKSVSIEYFGTKTLSNSYGTKTNELILSPAIEAFGNNKTPKSYTATYTFDIIGRGSGAIAPVAQISSGTQIKHTDMSGFYNTDGSAKFAASSTSVTVSATVGKAGNEITASGNNAEIKYTLTISNTNQSNALVIDKVIDMADSDLTLTSAGQGNSSFTGYTGFTDFFGGTASGGVKPWTFQGPFSIPANSSIKINYIMSATCVAGSNSYTNYALAYIGDVAIGQSASQYQQVNVSATQTTNGTTCGVSSPSITQTSQTFSTEVTTGTATNLSTSSGSSSAKLNGFVDSNGTSGQAITCEYSTESNLAGSTSVSASVPSGGTTTTSNDPVAVECNLTGLLPGTTYYYRVSSGGVNGTILSFTTPPNTLNAPEAITTSVSGVTTTSAVFNASVNPGMNTSRVKFEYAVATDSTCSSLSSNQTITEIDYDPDSTPQYTNLVLGGGYPTAVSFEKTGLTQNTNYCYRVIADYVFDATASPTHTNSVNGNWVFFRASSTQPPQATTEPATSVASTSAVLNGTATKGTNNGTVTFCLSTTAPTNGQVSCSTSITATQSPVTSGTISVSATASNLTGGTLYYFQTKVVDTTASPNLSALGLVESFTTPGPPTATTSAASSVMVTTATISGNVSANGANATVYFCYVASGAAGATETTAGKLNHCWDGTALVNGNLTNPTITSAVTTEATKQANLTGLTGGTTYKFQIIATNANGTAFGNVLTFTTNSNPTALTTSATSVTTTGAQLNGSINPGGAATNAKFCWGTASNLSGCTEVSATQSPLAAGGSSVNVSVSLTGLSASTTYYFRVSAQHVSGGNWVNSTQIENFTTAEVVPQPTTSGATNVAATTVTVNGSIIAGSLDATPSFIVSTSNQLSGGALTQNAGLTSGSLTAISAGQTASRSQNWTGFTQGSTYYFQIVATTTGGTYYGNVQSFTAGAAATAPTASTNAASSVTSTTVTLNGTVDPNNGNASIHFCYGTAADLTGCTKTSGNPSSGSGATSVSSTLGLTGLTPGTVYYFRIIGNNGVGGDANKDVFGTIESFRTLAQPTSTTNNASSITETAATINGTVNPGGATTTVTFCWGTDSNLAGCASVNASPNSLNASFNNSSVSANLTGLTGGTTYYFRVRATNSVGGPVNGTILSFTTTAVQQQGGGGGGGGGSSTPSPTPTPTVSPTPTPSPTQTTSPRPTPRPTNTSRPTPRPTASPSPSSTASATPTTSPTQSARPTASPSPSRTTPAPNSTSIAAPPSENREVGTGLENWLTKDVPNNNRPQPTRSPEPSQSPEASASPSPSESPTEPAENGNGRSPIIKYDTGAELKLTETGAIDIKSVKSVSPSELATERITGFTPGTSLNIEVLGSRTGARFVASTAALVDELVLIEAIRNSIPAQAADFFQLSTVRVGSEPEKPEPWTEQEKAVAYDYFQASGLPLPVSLADLNLNEYGKWIELTSNAAGYVPGTKVFLTLTSTPLVISEGIVDKDGRIQLTGSLPVEFLNAGEHRVRLVGIRSLGGVGVDENGEITLSEETMLEIERFDLGTQATVRMGGTTPEGDYLNAIRVVPLIPVAPWWTLWFILVGFLVAAFARRKNWSNTKVKYLLTVSLNLAAAIPAVVIGWLSTVTLVTWVGLGVGLLAAGLTILVRPKRERERANA